MKFLTRLLGVPHALYALLLLPACAAPVQATVVSLTTPNGREATAEYRPGRDDLPAVMIVHGFLQTREFPTVTALADALARAGHTVLTPTLTLNLSRRRQSLPCEAVHTHTLEMDTAEVAAWSEWMQRHGHRQLVLIGHSHGALAILPYLRRPAPVVKQAILLGLTDVKQEFAPEVQRQLVRDLEARVARRDPSLVATPYAFCQRYVAPPQSLLSYVRLRREDIFGWLAASRVPVLVLLGERDERLGDDWAKVLRKRGVPVEVMADASHFFDGTAEFDLQDRLLRALERLRE